MGCGKVVAGLSVFVQAALAVAVIVIVSTKLDNYSFTAAVDAAVAGQSYGANTCLLGTNKYGTSNCLISYIWSSVSLAATLALGVLLCCTCNW